MSNWQFATRRYNIHAGASVGTVPRTNASAWSRADRVMIHNTGLAPELPEDLYMLIKKVGVGWADGRTGL